MNSFEYFFTRTSMGELEVEDIGNCTIEASNDDGMFFYLNIQTNMGWTKITEYGPATPDCAELPKSVYCGFSRIEFDSRKICKKIQEFLNSPTRNITQAQVVDDYIMFDNCKSILEYIQVPENF